MLEIIYDARLVTLDPRKNFKFFGVKVGDNYGWSRENFSDTHPSWDGGVYIEPGPSIAHFYSHTKNGHISRGAQGCLEFIVPVIGEVPKYIKKLEGADGIYLCDKMFKTIEAFTVGPNFYAETDRFRVPPDHFYFLGVYDA